MKKIIFIISLFYFMLGCESGPKVGVDIEESNFSVTEIRKAIVAIAGEPREISQNKREFKTNYFSRKAGVKYNPQKDSERAYAYIVVLGERRPYTIQVAVLVEKRVHSEFQPLGEDKTWTNRVKNELLQQLNQSRDNRNIIDDFKSF